jgi:heme exporter protein A
LVFHQDLSLHAHELALARGGRRLAQGLSFTLKGGEALLVTGPNGAGKSTLLRVLASLLAPASGRLSLDGAGVEAPGLAAHYLGHAEALKGALTARENLEFWSEMLTMGDFGLSPDEALARVAMSHAPDLPVSYLSAGQRRRVAIARLLVAPRPLWLLDEPATALDAASQTRLAALMKDHLASGGIIVAATHADLGLPARELRLGAKP